MKSSLGVVPAIFVLGAVIAAGAGVGVPTALAEMQHRNMTKFTPGDLPYGIMRAGEAVMGLYQLDKGKWNGELLRVREMERTELQKKCPSCAQQLGELEQEKVRIMEQERQRVIEEQRTEAETRAGEGTGQYEEERTRIENRTYGQEPVQQPSQQSGQQPAEQAGSQAGR